MAKILVLASTFPRWQGDSVPPFVFHLSVGLASCGHEVHVLAPHTKGAAREERLGPLQVHRFQYAPTHLETLAYDGGIPENLRRHPLRWALVPPFLLAELVALLRLARRHQPQVLHAHWWLPQGLVTAIARLLLRRPMLLTLHGADFLTTRGLLRRTLLRLVTRSAFTCTVVNTNMQAAFAELTGKQALVIPMGVDVKAFEKLPAHVPPRTPGSRPFRLLFVGRLAEKKGLRHFIEALAEIYKRRSEAAITATVIGDGPERSQLGTQVATCGLNNVVLFVGAIDNRQLPDHYQAADAVVVPSVVTADGDTEGLPVVLLEAAACGVPIVASRVGGIPDFVTHEETGLLVEPGHPSALADAILHLATNPELRQRLAMNARARVVKDFSWESISNRFDVLIRDSGQTGSQTTQEALKR